MATRGLRLCAALALALAAAGCTAPEDGPSVQGNTPAPASNQASVQANEQAPAAVNQANATRSGESFHALGTEPFWGITIANGRLDYDDAGSDERFSVPAPMREDVADGWVWRTPRITVRASVAPCNDGMSLRVFPVEVRITLSEPSHIAGRTWPGCGGYARGDSLDGSAWQITMINEDEVSGASYRLEFTEDRVTGQAGCNRFNAPYRRGEHGEITFGAFATTRMACPEPRMTHERSVLEFLGRPSTFYYSDSRTAALGSELGGMMLRRIR